MRKFVLRCVGALSIAVMMAVAASGALASGSHHQKLPAEVQKMCNHNPMFCAGHWTKVGGARVFMIEHQVVIGGNGTGKPTAVASRLGWQTIANHGTGSTKCMSSYTGMSQPVAIWQCNGSANQTWDIFFYGGIQWGFLDQGSSLCMNNRQGLHKNYSWVVNYTCDQDLNEQFILDAQGGGFEIQIVGNFQAAGFDQRSGYCLTDLGLNNNGQGVETFDCNGSANQTWGQA